MLNIAHEIVAWLPSNSCKEKRPELSMVRGNATFVGCRSNVVPIHPETPKAPNLRHAQMSEDQCKPC